MNWNCRKWPVKYRLLMVFVVFVLSLFFFATKAYAEEEKTAGDHVKAAVFDTLAGVAATLGAAEQAVTGNPVTGAVLATLAAKEFIDAYKEGKDAWNLYRAGDDNSNDRPISPEQANIEHGNGS